MSKVVQRTMNIPGSSVPCESTFSIAGYIRRKERCSLSSAAMRYSMVLKDSARLVALEDEQWNIMSLLRFAYLSANKQEEIIWMNARCSTRSDRSDKRNEWCDGWERIVCFVDWTVFLEPALLYLCWNIRACALPHRWKWRITSFQSSKIQTIVLRSLSI